MSDDDTSDTGSSSDESEDINVSGLVATRARRGNAGNLYETLRAHLDDEDLQRELLAEDEADDAEDYEGSDVDGDDDSDALDSSSDDEDAGPPKENDAEELAGEKELLKAERAENNKKRKAQAARLTVPAWHKSSKKVKLADEVTADDGSSLPMEPSQKKKKSERDDRRLAGEFQPKRQSARASAVANREITQANLEESAQRARKQKATLQGSAKRERANARAELTLEQRLEKCRRIEKETAKQLGRFEREEAERVRAREEALMAKRRRNIDGPIIKTVTTSGYYENGKLKVKRLLHGSQNVDDIMQAQKVADELEAQQSASVTEDLQAPPAAQKLSDIAVAQNIEPDQQDLTDLPLQPDQVLLRQPNLVDVDTVQPSDRPVLEAARLQGVSEESVGRQQISPISIFTPSAAQQDLIKSEPSDVVPTPTPNASDLQAQEQRSIAITITKLETQENTPTALFSPAATNPAWPPGSQAFRFTPIAPIIAESPAPVLREQAQRSLVILESFDSLDGATTRRSRVASTLEPNPVAQILLPDSYPLFNDEQATYLRKARKLKQDLLVRSKCALTTWPGKYRDPKTGVVFADVAAYKMLQRMIAGGCAWNSMLECWVGPAYGQMGRPARGVPAGFDTPNGLG